MNRGFFRLVGAELAEDLGEPNGIQSIQGQIPHSIDQKQIDWNPLPLIIHRLKEKIRVIPSKDYPRQEERQSEYDVIQFVERGVTLFEVQLFKEPVKIQERSA